MRTKKKKEVIAYHEKILDRKICREKKLSFSTTGVNEREYFLNFQLHIFLGIPSGRHSTIIFFTDTLFRGISGSTTQIKFSSKESQSLFKMSQSNLAYTPRQPFLHPQPPNPNPPPKVRPCIQLGFSLNLHCHIATSTKLRRNFSFHCISAPVPKII